MIRRITIAICALICLSVLQGCVFHKKLKPLPAVDNSNPDVWASDKCKGKAMVWWGQQGQDPSKNNDIWHCGPWILYHKDVAP